MGIINILASNNYITVNKIIAQELGLNEAILLGELASEYEYWERQEQLDNGYFFSTIENVYKNTTLTGRQQRTAINNLKEQGIIDVVIKGMPAKRYIKINEMQVIQLCNIKLCENVTSSCAKMSQQEVTKCNCNKNNINKNNNKNNDNIYTAEFEKLWQKYPNKKGKTEALKAYIKARKQGEDYSVIEKGIETYAEYCKGKDKQYIKHGSTYFNQRCWTDEYTTEDKPIKKTAFDVLREMYEEAENEEAGDVKDNFFDMFKLPELNE